MEFLMGILCIKSFGAAFFPRSRSSQVDKRGRDEAWLSLKHQLLRRRRLELRPTEKESSRIPFPKSKGICKEQSSRREIHRLSYQHKLQKVVGQQRYVAHVVQQLIPKKAASLCAYRKLQLKQMEEVHLIRPFSSDAPQHHHLQMKWGEQQH